MKKLSVTIATYNRCAILEKVLIALADQNLERDKYEIVVCDSKSMDGTENFIKQFAQLNKDLSIKHVHTENILACKRNLGIAEASHPIVIFLDDDCVPDRDFLNRYYELVNAPSFDGSRMVYCGEVRFPAEWVSHSNYYRYRDEEGFYQDQIGDGLLLDFKTIVVMNMAFEKEHFLQRVRWVDESFVGYGCEDQDLGWRIQRAGFEIHACSALIYHFEASGTISGYAKKIFHTARDGANTLWNKSPEAAKSIGTMKWIDFRYPHKWLFQRCFYALIRKLVFNRIFSVAVQKFLKSVDSRPYIYLPKLHKFVLACAYVEGASQRFKSQASSSNWYQ